MSGVLPARLSALFDVHTYSRGSGLIPLGVRAVPLNSGVVVQIPRQEPEVGPQEEILCVPTTVFRTVLKIAPQEEQPPSQRGMVKFVDVFSDQVYLMEVSDFTEFCRTTTWESPGIADGEWVKHLWAGSWYVRPNK